MNYLAHLFLSGEDEDLIVGNFIADAVKGSQIEQYSEGIRKGIQLHRKIDSFTDKHEIVRKSKARLIPEFHKYSPVIVDVFYDHFMASDWMKYSEVNFRAYCDSMYKLLKSKSSVFPQRSKRFLFYLRRNDMLFHYRSILGVQMTLQVLSHRATFKSDMHLAHHNLLRDYNLYKEEFTLFFEELRKETLLFINT